MRVDLHLHTKENSDGKAPAAEMIRAGIERGLDGLVITDHHYMLTRAERNALQQQFPDCRIFRGAEVSVGVDDVLVIGGSAEQVPDVTPETVSDLGAYARDTEAFTALAHPFWRGPELHFDLDDFCPEGIEVASMNVDSGRFERILDIARERGMVPTAGTDAHNPREVAMFHVVLDERAETDEELVLALRSGSYCIGTVPELWDARCREVRSNEELALSVIREGGTKEDYLERGGHPAFFGRVRDAGSHMPREEWLGLRSADVGLTVTR